MTSALDRLFKGLDIFIAVLLAGMVLLVFGNVVLRYGLASSIIVSEEVSRFFMVWLVFVGAVLAAHSGDHLGSDTLIAKLSPRAQRFCAVLSQLVILLCCAVLAWGLWRQHELYAGTVAPVSGVSMIWVYGVGYVTAAAIAVIAVFRAIRIIRNRATAADLGIADTGEVL